MLSQEKRKSAKNCENQRETAKFGHLSLLVCPLEFPLNLDPNLESVSTGVWCVLGFGAGFDIALEPSKLQKQAEKLGKGAFIFCANSWYAPNPGSRDLTNFGAGRMGSHATLTTHTPLITVCAEISASLILPAVTYVILLRVLWKPCSRHRKFHISEINSDQGQINRKHVIRLEINSPTNFSVYVIYFYIDSKGVEVNSLN